MKNRESIMKKTITLKKQSISKCAALLLSALLAIWIFGLLSSFSRTRMKELTLTPLLSDANGWDIYTIENGRHKELAAGDIMNLETGKVFYLSRILTKEDEDVGFTFLTLEIMLPCAVFIDGKLLYSNCPGDDMRMDNISFPQNYTVTPAAPGERVHCTLPAHFAGARLTIATAHTDSELISMPSVNLSSGAAESASLIAGISGELIPAAGFATLALFLSGVWLFAFFQGIHDYPSILLILAALIQMFSHLRQFEFLTPLPYVMASPLSEFIPIIEVILPHIWLLLQMKNRSGRRIFTYILALSTAISLISPIMGLFGNLPFYSPFLEKRAILFIPLAALLFFAVREALLLKNRIFILLLYGLGITICLTAALYTASICGEGYYAGRITSIFRELGSPTINLFFYWCAIILFALSTILALHQIIRRIAGIRTDLALQTERARALDSRLASQKDFYEARLAHENAIRSLRHDMAGHLNTLAVLLDNNKPEDAKKYLAGITKYHKEQSVKIYSNNPYINAVLQNYAAKCLKEHIELTCSIGIGDCELPATELCLILNNALENAVEASLTMPDGEKEIKVQAAVQKNQFLLRVSNRFDGLLTIADELPVSGKEGEGHGYGLSNIRQAAERKNGYMEYHVQNGYFVLDVAFETE
ncbi:MAG: GHKL domain-containing protein [Blautia sp.]|nr:GHKL domain-containing protein [Blautia sp.]